MDTGSIMSIRHGLHVSSFIFGVLGGAFYWWVLGQNVGVSVRLRALLGAGRSSPFRAVPARRMGRRFARRRHFNGDHAVPCEG
jgi:hypothetical protein